MNENILNHINKGEVVAIIPARSGSKGIKNKNIYPLCGYPLIAYSIIAAQKSSKISRILVSTDSEIYANIAKVYGAEVPFLRPASISGDNAKDIAFLEHTIQWLYEAEKSVPEFFVHLRPTCPLRNPVIIDKAIQEIIDNPKSTSLRSAHRVLHTPYKWFRKTEDDLYYRGIIDNLTNDEINNPRQEFCEVYEPDGYVDVLKTEFIIKTGLMHGERMIAFESPNAVDIDTIDDINYLDYLLQKNSNELVSLLKKEHLQ